MKPDGGWGWVVAFATSLIYVLIDGVKYSFGIIFIELTETFHGSKSKTSWVMSIQVGVMLLSGPIMAALVNRFGCRTIAVIGTIVSSGGFIASAFVSSVYTLYATYGFVAGFGFGMMALPCRVMLVKYFDKRLAFATGFANMGTGVGALVFNPLAKALIDEYTWRGTMLAEAGIILNGLVCALVFKIPGKINDHGTHTRYNNGDREQTTEVNQSLINQANYDSCHTYQNTKVESKFNALNVEQITEARSELFHATADEQREVSDNCSVKENYAKVIMQTTMLSQMSSTPVIINAKNIQK